MSFISSISLILSSFKSFNLFNSCISFSSFIRSFIGSLKFLSFQLNSSLHTFISCHFTSFHVRFFHSVIQSFMDSFMLLVSFAFMSFSWHLENHVNLSLLLHFPYMLQSSRNVVNSVFVQQTMRIVPRKHSRGGLDVCVRSCITFA